MPDVSFTLKDLFDLSDIAPQRLAALASSERIAPLKNVLSGRVPQVTWPVALEEIMKKANDLLDISVPELAGAAWNKYQVLRKYTDTKKYPPDETIVAPLATHTIRSEHKPYVEILVGDKPVGRVHFAVDLELTLEGVVLSIRGGKIVGMRLGSCQGKGQLSCEGAVIAEKETRSLPLSGVIPLGEGIPIPSTRPDGHRGDTNPSG